jgi:hypothetical protein
MGNKTMEHPKYGLQLSGPARALLALLPLSFGAAPCMAAPSFYGTTGLFASPVAAVPARGTWSVGSNYVGRDFRPGASVIAKGTIANYFAVTMLPRVEMTLVLTNYEGKVGTRNLKNGLTPDFSLGGYTVDRTFSGQWLAVTQHGDRPAIAFGARDILGRSVKHLHAQYGVMSFQRGKLMLSAGLGTQALHGPFGGIEYAILPRISAVAEGLYGQTNGGFRLVPLKDFQMDLAMMDFRSLAGGLSYHRRF